MALLPHGILRDDDEVDGKFNSRLAQRYIASRAGGEQPPHQPEPYLVVTGREITGDAAQEGKDDARPARAGHSHLLAPLRIEAVPTSRTLGGVVLREADGQIWHVPGFSAFRHRW